MWQRSDHALRLLTLAMLAVVLFGCGSTRNLEETPRVSVVGLVPESIELLEQRYTLRLRVQNPNRVDLGIQGMNYTIEINDREFARGVSDRDVLIPAFGEQVVEVSVVSNLYSFIRQLSALEDRKAPLAYSISGRFALKGIPGTIPFSYDGELVLGALRSASLDA